MTDAIGLNREQLGLRPDTEQVLREMLSSRQNSHKRATDQMEEAKRQLELATRAVEVFSRDVEHIQREIDQFLKFKAEQKTNGQE